VPFDNGYVPGTVSPEYPFIVTRKNAPVGGAALKVIGVFAIKPSQYDSPRLTVALTSILLEVLVAVAVYDVVVVLGAEVAVVVVVTEVAAGVVAYAFADGDDSFIAVSTALT
jgi:hypothetical protein